MRKYFMILGLIAITSSLLAQDEEEKEKTAFRENLFTGGSISAGFGNNYFLIGGSPVIGYSLTNWVDAGVVLNYTYTSYRDYQTFDDRLRQTVYGGGPFLRIYPVRFLFLQGQYEHNFIKQKYISPSLPTEVRHSDANSFLVGGGYCTGRYGKGGNPFFYMSLLFDVSGNANSPYTDAFGRTVPILKGGIQVPLFQGKGR